MSIRELEELITKLEKTKEKTKSGGACKGAGKGRKKKQCHCAGELLDNDASGSGLSGGTIQDFSGSGLTGGEIQDFSGQGLTGGKKRGRKKKTGGNVSDFAGESEGGILSGGAVPKQLQGWLSHVKATKEKHPGVAYKEILQIAKKSYK